MTHLAVVLQACVLLHIRDPFAEFYTMPASLQTLWTEHAANLFSGAYEAVPKGSSSVAAGLALERELLSAA